MGLWDDMFGGLDKLQPNPDDVGKGVAAFIKFVKYFRKHPLVFLLLLLLLVVGSFPAPKAVPLVVWGIFFFVAGVWLRRLGV